jgi:hypothetical protein
VRRSLKDRENEWMVGSMFRRQTVSINYTELTQDSLVLKVKIVNLSLCLNS